MENVTIYHKDGSTKQVRADVARNHVWADRDWSLQPPPPPGWEREVPKYRLGRAVHPSPKARHRLEPPFASTTDSDLWQYAERPYKAGEIIETKSWPHPSFQPLNYSATKVLEFFNSATKSRLPLSPWAHDRIRLDNGLSMQWPSLPASESAA